MWRQPAAGGWVRHSVGGSVAAYLDLNAVRVAWQPPDRRGLSSNYLGQETLQVGVRCGRWHQRWWWVY